MAPVAETLVQRLFAEAGEQFGGVEGAGVVHHGGASVSVRNIAT
jgi:hypothetical protein